MIKNNENTVKIYLAGPFFNKKSINDNKIAADILKELYGEENVFVPQEHEIPDAWSLDNDAWAKRVFEMDIAALKKSDVVFVCYYGMDSDSGTSFEQGYAHALGKSIIILNFASDNVLSLMNVFGSDGIIDCRNTMENLKKLRFDDLKNYELK